MKWKNKKKGEGKKEKREKNAWIRTREIDIVKRMSQTRYPFAINLLATFPITMILTR